MSALADYIAQHQAGAEAVGMLEALLADGDIPRACRAQAAQIIDKFNGRTTKERNADQPHLSR